MKSDPTQVSYPMDETVKMTTAEIVDRLSRFDGPPEQFLVTLLAVQCRLASAEAGVILRATQDGNIELLAIFPPLPEGATAPVWLAQAVESAPAVLREGTTAVSPIHDTDSMYGQPAKKQIIMTPILGGGSVRGLAAYLVNAADAGVLAHCRERLELSISLLSLYEMRLTLQRRGVDLSRLRIAMETLSAVNEHDRFAGAGMAFCNEIASRWECDRVSLGFLMGRYVKLKALSHTEKFSRKMKLVQDIESAMEECLDQDLEILYPASQDATYVYRSTGELSRLHGPMTIVSAPLRRAGDVVGILTVERGQDHPFTTDQIESLRLTCELCTARLTNLHETDRWFGARAAVAARKGLTHLLGPKHTWFKVAGILVLAFVLFTVLAKGNYNADASFVLEAQQQRLIPAPFEGYIEAVHVEPGDTVIARVTILAKLETTRLESELIKNQADHAAALTEGARALNEGKIAEAQIAKAQADKAAAQIELLAWRIREASITSPIDGTVISQDIKRRIRGHVDIGEAMFEVAPVENLRAELSVPEDQIADVTRAFKAARRQGQTLTGKLALVGEPERSIEFEVERVNPVAEIEDKDNVFKVRVRLLQTHPGMVPGMKGVAKIRLDRRIYARLWTRRLINWVRMKLWW